VRGQGQGHHQAQAGHLQVKAFTIIPERLALTCMIYVVVAIACGNYQFFNL
jgi:hypothetical protein